MPAGDDVTSDAQSSADKGRALAQFQAAPAETPMIGDNLRDLEAAAAVGCPRHLVRTGHGAKAQADGIPPAVLPVRVHDDLAAAVTALLGPE